ncbi:uncharacterized protein LOC133522709 [Cydia pomonella]|uniref:uncharacterized protein LOC133522709 n=1 Tax=Cydia pomonella TaxID=82600 RepID=UPI002ADD7162|nr:uncharacterized protein LOC133522709 [Cydia pomonella]
MDWTTENIIEFLELLQTEPSIWNHRARTHRNRTLVSEAWNRIQNNFSLSCPVEELKRKRNSLLTQYRDILRRIKESQRKASEGDGHEIYKPSWFAFDVMNSYLSHLYESPVTVKPEELASYDEDPLSNDSDTYNEFDKSHIHIGVERINPNKRSVAWEPRILHTRRLSHDSTPSEQDYCITKKQRAMHELRVPAQDREFPNVNERHREQDNVRECDLYGQLLAEKLKPLEQDDRLQLMNEIDNLVFNYLMRIRKRKASQNNLSGDQPMHLPGPSSKMPTLNLVNNLSNE